MFKALYLKFSSSRLMAYSSWFLSYRSWFLSYSSVVALSLKA
nr:MAG TPA: hypothetical protein [Caudoviricetes sp.]